ncbi:MAG: acylase [Firmicutes bacterium]|nr:acylase [Bacillota bacterium]
MGRSQASEGRRSGRLGLRCLVVAVLLLVTAVLAWLFAPLPGLDHQTLARAVEAARAYDVRILRDTWGVPHVFGRTDADCAFGLAYAHAEDDFLTIQQSLAAARGQLASIYGPDAAANDYMVGLLRLWDTVNSRYEVDLSPETRSVCEGYAAGLNYYAALHPDEVLPGLFPVTGKDVVAGSVHKSPLFFGLDKALAEMFAPERRREVSGRLESEGGSNTFAVSPLRSTEGRTYLAVNSHQPWEGPVTWYEAHLHSEEGLDVAGALFPGMPLVVQGLNRYCGWAFTVNKPDLVDIYVLTTHPEDPDLYLFDGEWRELEVREVPIRVRLLGRLTWTVRKEALWSVYGPVVRATHGTYAIRYANMDRAGLYEQLYRMVRARDLDEWLRAVSLRGFASFNLGYADREGNIAYVYNGAIPVRSERYDWSLYLPGDTSETLWTEYIPFEALPMVINPSSGFVQNCNSTPFQTTTGPDNPRPEDFSRTLGIETDLTNRALRALELFGSDPAITPEEFRTYKYDMAYSTRSVMAELVGRLTALTPAEVEELRASAEVREDERLSAFLAGPDFPRALEVFRAWDFRTDPQNRGAALAVLTVQPVGRREEVSTVELLRSLAEAVRVLTEHHGRLDPEWGEVNRLRRGKVDLPLGGGPDCLRNIAGRLQPDGRIRANIGDSYVMLVTWERDGTVSAVSIHQYGSATLDPDSPHYADQAPLFARLEMKPVWMDEADIRANLEREYRPGE